METNTWSLSEIEEQLNNLELTPNEDETCQSCYKKIENLELELLTLKNQTKTSESEVPAMVDQIKTEILAEVTRTIKQEVIIETSKKVKDDLAETLNNFVTKEELEILKAETKDELKPGMVHLGQELASQVENHNTLKLKQDNTDKQMEIMENRVKHTNFTDDEFKEHFNILTNTLHIWVLLKMLSYK